MTKTKSSTVSLLAIAAVVVTAIIVYTMACLLTGNITPVARVCAILFPVWFRGRAESAVHAAVTPAFPFLSLPYHRLTRADAVLTGRNAPILRQVP